MRLNHRQLLLVPPSCGFRNFLVSTASSSFMHAWQIDSFDGDLKLNQVAMPSISRPSELLVEVKAASVNPIDIRMRAGYGQTMIGLLRQLDARSVNSVLPFPLTLGRDCSGVVVEVGRNVKRFRPGHEVFCAIGAQKPGTHAEYVVIDEDSAALKPHSITHAQSAGLPYVAATVWSALVNVAHLTPHKCQQIRALVHGGSGGIGTFAIQLLKAWGATVTTTCALDSFERVASMGAVPVDYKGSDAYDRLVEQSPFDVILDAVDSPLARQSADLLGIWRHCVYVSLVSPVLRDSDQYGFPAGLFCSAAQYFERATQLLPRGRWFSYSFFAPNADCLAHVGKLVDEQKLKPVIERVVPFKKTPEAYEKVGQFHGRGKTVIDMSTGME